MRGALRAIGLTVFITIALSGCKNANDSGSAASVPSQAVESAPSSNSSVISSSASESSGAYIFSDEEIESAENAAKEYYKGTVLKPQSFQYVAKHWLYEQHSPEYGKDNLIVFTVIIENSEKPPRAIILGRKDSNIDWKVVNEGY